MEKSAFQLDDLDKKILRELIQDSRKAFTELAEELGVSGGTIHGRVDKLREAGVIQGSKFIVDTQALGYTICAFVGINLQKARDYPTVLEQLCNINRITEAHYTTGQYNIFTKIYATSIADLHQFLLELQKIQEINGTDTIMVLDTPIYRDLDF